MLYPEGIATLRRTAKFPHEAVSARTMKKNEGIKVFQLMLFIGSGVVLRESLSPFSHPGLFFVGCALFAVVLVSSAFSHWQKNSGRDL